MKREAVLRRALWFAAVFNVGGAYLFAFPASPIGSLMGLPSTVPAVYRAFTALFILLFGGAYVWLANHQSIIRPFVAFAAIGKASAFVLALALSFFGEVSPNGIALISGDLILAALFMWCLAGTRHWHSADRA